MKGKLFLVIVVFLTAITSLRAQETDPDYFFLQEKDSLVFLPIIEVNTFFDEFLPVIINNALYFNSDRVNRSGDEAELARNENLYSARRGYDGYWGNVEKNYFWNSDDQTVIVGFNEGNLFQYKTFGNGDLYISSLIKGKWSPPKKLTPPINSEGHEQSIAYLNELLVLSSERAGSQSHDIYWTRTSSIYEVKELVAFPYNTSADEIDVSLSPDGRTMYFSSDRNGNYDIFMSTFENSIWQQPICLPAPINSSDDDSGFRNCDSVFYMDSDRNGNYDIFEGYTWPRKIDVKKLIATLVEKEAQKDTLLVVERSTIQKNIVADVDPSHATTAQADTSIVIEVNQPNRFDLIDNYMDSVGNIQEYYARVQIGAYYRYSVQEFKKVHPSLKNTEVIIETVKKENGGTIQKFLIGQKFSRLKDAAPVQREMIDKHNIKDAFIAVYTLDNKRVAIYNTVEEEFVLLSGDKKPVKF
ncbi:MAG: hypothetical protein ABH951_02585 [Patescibacteria group bacterium]